MYEQCMNDVPIASADSIGRQVATVLWCDLHTALDHATKRKPENASQTEHRNHKLRNI